MTHAELQAELKRLGTYHGAIDGRFFDHSKAALVAALSVGPDTPVTSDDIAVAAKAIGCPAAAIQAVWAVEAAGVGFQQGRPKILPEGHRFSKLTKHRYDRSHPHLSWPTWDKSKYPRTQAARYERLANMVALDVDAGLMACSYGAFQILGENYAACGHASPWAMVYDHSLTEGDQLDAFIRFVRSRRLDDELRALNWTAFARGYNGSAFRENRYDERLSAAYRAAGGR